MSSLPLTYLSCALPSSLSSLFSISLLDPNNYVVKRFWVTSSRVSHAFRCLLFRFASFFVFPFSPPPPQIRRSGYFLECNACKIRTKDRRLTFLADERPSHPQAVEGLTLDFFILIERYIRTMYIDIVVLIICARLDLVFRLCLN